VAVQYDPKIEMDEHGRNPIITDMLKNPVYVNLKNNKVYTEIIENVNESDYEVVKMFESTEWKKLYQVKSSQDIEMVHSALMHASYRSRVRLNLGLTPTVLINLFEHV